MVESRVPPVRDVPEYAPAFDELESLHRGPRSRGDHRPEHVAVEFDAQAVGLQRADTIEVGEVQLA